MILNRRDVTRTDTLVKNKKVWNNTVLARPIMKMCIRDRMESDPPSIQEIEEAISALRNNKAPGTDLSLIHI